jgi:hypothetical protein
MYVETNLMFLPFCIVKTQFCSLKQIFVLNCTFSVVPSKFNGNLKNVLFKNELSHNLLCYFSPTLQLKFNLLVSPILNCFSWFIKTTKYLLK